MQHAHLQISAYASINAGCRHKHALGGCGGGGDGAGGGASGGDGDGGGSNDPGARGGEGGKGGGEGGSGDVAPSSYNKLLPLSGP